MADETKVIRIVVDSSRAVDGSAAATRALANLEKQTAGMSSTLDRMEGALGRVGGYLKAQLALAIAVVGAHFVTMAKGAMDAAGGLDELAEQLGVTARGLQALQLSAAQNGAKMEQLEAGIGKFSQKMGEAAGGSKEMIEALNGLGVKILDANGKLRPTEALLQNVSAAILGIEDPARRAAAMVDFFGKSGTRMLPMLKDMAGGLDAMAARAQAAGAMISAEAIEKLDRMGDRAATSQLKLRALFAESLAGPLTTALEKVNALLERVIANVRQLQNDAPQTQRDVNLRAYLRDNQADLASETEARAVLLRNINSTENTLRNNPNRGASRVLLDEQRQKLAERDARIAELNRYGGVMTETLISNRIGPPQEPPPVVLSPGPRDGAKNPSVAGAGASETAKYEKLISQLTMAAEAQDRMTAAALRGDVAFEQQKIALDASQKALDIFGKALDANDPRLAKIEALMRRVGEGKAAEAFAVATTELEKQNVVLAAQNKLMNEAPEIQAREIALIKAKQEAEKGGAAITADMVEQRRAAIEQNETLKLQAEQMKATNELWTEPLKQGLRNIQTAGADAWETILETGKLSFESLGEVFTKTLRRMAAEFLALATIRPVMTMFVDAIGPGGIGMIGGNTATQLGGGAGSAGGFSLPQMPTGGGGLGSILTSGGSSGGGWLARQFSGVSDWLSSPVSGMFSSTPAGGFSNVGDLIGSGQTLASSSAGGGALGGLSIGGALGGLGSIGMGAYGLLKGGGSTASTIGSIGQIAGGVMMMIPGLQPFGAALSLLSSFVPGLFGDGPKTPPQPALAYGAGQFRPTGTGGYSYTGDSLGAGSPMNDAARQVAANLRKSFRAAGLSTVPGALIGGNLASGMDHQLQGGQWQDRPYTQTGLMLPGGGYEALTYNDASRNPQQASEYLVAQAFRANVLRGGVSGAGAGLKQGLERINPLTAEDLDNVIAMGTAYDQLGKATNSAKDGVDKLNAAFDDLKDYADRAGLAMEPINAELQKQTKRAAQDFIDQMLDPIAVQMRALADERESAMVSAQYIRDNIKDVYVDMDRIATYYTNKEAALRDQFYAGGVTKLQGLIDQLTYGDLANASPTLQLSGTKAAYNAALAQARAGDANAITNLSGYAESYLGVARQSFASSPEYQALVEQIRAALQELTITLTGGSTTAAGATTPAQQSVLSQQIAQALQVNQDLAAQVAARDAKIDQLVDLLQRYVTNRAA